MLVEKKKMICTVLLAVLAFGSLFLITVSSSSGGTVLTNRISEEELAAITDSCSPSESQLFDAVFFNKERLHYCDTYYQ